MAAPEPHRPAHADDGRWLEAVVTKCLVDDSSTAEARDFVIGYVISQLLWFWRHPIPEPWGTLSERWEYVAAMRLVYEPGHWVAGDQFDEELMPYRDQVYDAIRKNTWAAYSALPEQVWGWLMELTGLSREEWEKLPDEASQVLASTVICPTCGSDGSLKETAKPAYPTNPHFIGTRLDIGCSQCGSHMTFDVGARRVRKHSPRWTIVKIVVLVLVLGGLILYPLFTILRGMF